MTPKEKLTQAIIEYQEETSTTVKSMFVRKTVSEDIIFTIESQCL